MSDNEQQIYMQISNKIKEKYLDAQITNFIKEIKKHR